MIHRTSYTEHQSHFWNAWQEMTRPCDKMHVVGSHCARAGRFRYSIMAMLAATAAISTALGWYFRTQTHVAEALLQIEGPPWASVSHGLAANVFPDLDVYRETQAALIKSEWVLKSALQESEMRQLHVISSRVDPARWLSENLEVSFAGGGDLMRIQLHGPESVMPDYCTLIDAIIKRYLKEIVATDRFPHLEKVQRFITLRVTYIK